MVKKEVRYFQNDNADYYAVIHGHDKAEFIEVQKGKGPTYFGEMSLREFYKQSHAKGIYKHAYIPEKAAQNIVASAKKEKIETSKLVEELHKSKQGLDQSGNALDQNYLLAKGESRGNVSFNPRDPIVYQQNSN